MASVTSSNMKTKRAVQRALCAFGVSTLMSGSATALKLKVADRGQPLELFPDQEEAALRNVREALDGHILQSVRNKIEDDKAKWEKEMKQQYIKNLPKSFTYKSCLVV